MNGSIVRTDEDFVNRSQDESTNSDTDEFFDAADSELFVTEVVVSNRRQPTNVRRGARCPVQDLSLQQTGEQLYAPYLQRPFPLTDDVAAERGLMLYRQSSLTNTWQRLEVAHRILKPKLLSDMQSFKAANPGATFHDFVTWYGNPSDPLCVDETVSKQPNTKDGRADAKRTLDLTREFWVSTWEEAEPIPATEQGPLFDAESTVEMSLDYLENIHPASLLSQVAAVNLASAYFALVASAGVTLHVGVVSASLLHLRETIEYALCLLSADATNAIGSLLCNNKEKKSHQSMDHIGSKERASSSDIIMTSVEALAACSAACEALGSSEVIVSRAASLLHKMTQQYEVVDRILRSPEGTQIKVGDYAAQETLLHTIHARQKQIPVLDDVNTKLQPAMREYILRNLDDDNPCQLSVRYNDEGIKVCNLTADVHDGSTGIVLALAMTSRQ